jgi:SAM-dependent methyltransferase
MSDYEFWSSRYAVQAAWTKETRNFILQQISLTGQAKILEVGSGSLAVLNEFNELGHTTFGLDIDLQILRHSNNPNTKTKLINADGMWIPMTKGTFDLCFCHYLLLWLVDPISLVKEMARVTKNNGWICCFAEPDYLARIDFPPPLEQLGQIQNKSLADQGVNLSCGRNISFWLQQANLSNIHWGIIGSHQKNSLDNTLDSEWGTFQRDIERISSQADILRYKEFEQKFTSRGSRINFIPTFYAYAQKL